MIDDLIRENLKYDSRLYMVDPGSYYKGPSTVDKAIIKRENKKMLNEFVVDQIFSTVPNLSRKKKEKLNKHFTDIDEITLALKNESKETETVKEYVKRICA